MARKLPAWAMGLANAPLGFYFGFISTAMPFLLASRGISTARIAGISAIGFSPSFWAFLLSPLLDVRFRKRQYCVGCFSFAAVCLGFAVLSIGQLGLFTALLTLGCAAAVLGGYSLGALLIEVVDESEFGRLGGWVNVANLGAAGVFGTVTILLVQHAPLAVAGRGGCADPPGPVVALRLVPCPAAPLSRCGGDVSQALPRSLRGAQAARVCARPDSVSRTGKRLRSDQPVRRVGRGTTTPRQTWSPGSAARA